MLPSKSTPAGSPGRQSLKMAVTAGLLALTLTCQAGAQAAPADAGPVKISPADAQKAIAKLKELRELREGMRQNALQAGVKRIQEALAVENGPIELYEDCIKAEKYTGQNESMNSEYREWKSKSKDQMKDGDFRQCLRAHLQYLALSLEFLSVQEKKPELILPKLDAYMTSLTGLEIPERGPGKDLMTNPLSKSVFVQNLDLGGDISKLKNWEQVPNNIEGMEETTVLPLLREHAKDKVLPYWDRKIQRETAAAEKETLAARAEDFKTVRLPKLQWSRSEDMLALGQGQAAYQAMFQIISANPGHTDFPKWASTLEGYLKASIPAPVAPVTAVTPEPAADATAAVNPGT